MGRFQINEGCTVDANLEGEIEGGQQTEMIVKAI
jgi:hypothetical protein